jgi:hypothetical protein
MCVPTEADCCQFMSVGQREEISLTMSDFIRYKGTVIEKECWKMRKHATSEESRHALQGSDTR